MEKLKYYREELDEIDRELLMLLDKRFTITNEIGKIKKENDMLILDTNRENEILDRLWEYKRKNLSNNDIHLFWHIIFDLSRQKQG